MGFQACLWQPLYCFHFDFRYVTLIYIICIPMPNQTMIYFISWEKRWPISNADILKLGCNLCTEASPNVITSEPRKDAQVIQMEGVAAPQVF